VTLNKIKTRKMHQNKNQNTNNKHIPVMLDQVLEFLDPHPGDSYLDLTAGYGGHAQAVIALTGKPELAVLIDRDQSVVKDLGKLFSGVKQPLIINQDFFTASRELLDEGRNFDLILADLGVSSPHLNEGTRGFSFQHDGPLDMRMDQRGTLTAETIVNSYSKEELSSIFKEFGEEPKAKKIADKIIANRPLKSTSELARIVAAVWKGNSRVHPATRTFQALRIVVNDELGLLEASLPIWHKLLNDGGRIIIISFHSLEDRHIKRFFVEHGGNYYDSTLNLLTKRPARADPNELVLNPRARSAKLRAAAKINNKRKGATHANSGKKQIPSVQGSS
jgi:16S rRNA (cytosine1402-N4)-methyltransferase